MISRNESEEKEPRYEVRGIRKKKRDIVETSQRAS